MSVSTIDRRLRFATCGGYPALLFSAIRNGSIWETKTIRPHVPTHPMCPKLPRLTTKLCLFLFSNKKWQDLGDENSTAAKVRQQTKKVSHLKRRIKTWEEKFETENGFKWNSVNARSESMPESMPGQSRVSMLRCFHSKISQ